jgi:hypothetical protein
MVDLLRFGLGLVADLVRGRAALLAENAMIRQQLIAAQRKIHVRVRARIRLSPISNPFPDRPSFKGASSRPPYSLAASWLPPRGLTWGGRK